MNAGFRIAFSDLEAGCLRARVTGIRSPESTIAYWETLLEHIAAERPVTLLVMDELLGEELSASEWKALVQKMIGRGLEGIRIAHVKLFAIDQIDYCEVYANKAGLATRAFRDESAAIRWLQGDARSSPVL